MKDIFTSTHELCEEYKEKANNNYSRDREKANLLGRKEVFIAWKRFTNEILGYSNVINTQRNINAIIKEIEDVLK